MPKVTFENPGLCELEAVIILMRKGAKWHAFSRCSGHLTLHHAQSCCLAGRKAWETQPFPLPKRHLLAPAGKVKADPKATIPSVRVRTTETRACADARTRKKSTGPFCVGKSREILAIVALLRIQKSFRYTNLAGRVRYLSFVHLPSQPQKKSRSRANSVA